MNTQTEDVNVTGFKMSFRVLNTSKDIVNLLRYGLISCVEVPSVKEVNVHFNTSCLTDDMIAHRIGLLNIDLDVGEAPCLELKVHCDQDELVVTSGMVMCKDVRLSHSDELIVILHQGEKLEFDAVVHKGFGSQHSRFSSVCGIFFKPDPEVRVNARKKKIVSKDVLNKVYNSCPRGVFTPEMDIENATNCIFCGQCEQIEPNLVSVSSQEKNYTFTFESTGVAKPDILLKKSIHEILGRLDTVRKHAIDEANGINNM
jgi:DNA-directed RNA polymerase subunit D